MGAENPRFRPNTRVVYITTHEAYLGRTVQPVYVAGEWRQLVVWDDGLVDTETRAETDLRKVVPQ